MPRVYPAEQYRFGALSSMGGDASGMLLRQYQFPDAHLDHEQIITADHDRCLSADYDHARRCFNEHFHTGEFGMQSWLNKAKDEEVFAFLKDILKADPNITWTGYRILATVHRGYGYPVFTMQLFAKDPASDTKTYTGADAPNVERVPSKTPVW